MILNPLTFKKACKINIFSQNLHYKFLMLVCKKSKNCLPLVGLLKNFEK